jgi:signal transduction protein with GAF and PtsI domain
MDTIMTLNIPVCRNMKLRSTDVERSSRVRVKAYGCDRFDPGPYVITVTRGSSKMHEEISKWFLKGIAASPGVVIGKACVLQDILLMVKSRSLKEAYAEEEVIRLKQAIRQVIDELMEDNSRMSLKIRQKEAEIFLTHLAILKDPYFIAHILRDIRKNGVNAESAVVRQVDEFGETFRKMDDPYLFVRGQGGKFQTTHERS